MKIRWGILGPGDIAKTFASNGIAQSRTGVLAAVATRSPEKPGLAAAFTGARIIHGYEALLSDPHVDAVYIATPHMAHAEWAVRAALSGKHVLVEKPLGVTSQQASSVFAAATRGKVFAGEAFMYRLHPQTSKLIELVADGCIGEVRMIRSNFGFAMPWFMPEHRMYSKELAGGGILDVGCYPVSMARLIAGAASGKPFLDPDKVVGAAHLGQSGVDEWASATLQFPGGIVADVSCSVSVWQDNVLRIFGTKGRIEVDYFWYAGGKDGGTGLIRIFPHGKPAYTVEVPEARSLYSFQVDAVADAIQNGRQEFKNPGMSWLDSLGNMRTLDRWRQAVNLQYECDRTAAA